MAMQQGPDTLTPREYETMEYEKEMYEKQADFNLKMAHLETKWASWFKIPLTIIKLPVYILFAVAYCIAIARKHEPGENFWRFMR